MIPDNRHIQRTTDTDNYLLITDNGIEWYRSPEWRPKKEQLKGPASSIWGGRNKSQNAVWIKSGSDSTFISYYTFILYPHILHLYQLAPAQTTIQWIVCVNAVSDWLLRHFLLFGGRIATSTEDCYKPQYQSDQQLVMILFVRIVKLIQYNTFTAGQDSAILGKPCLAKCAQEFMCSVVNVVSSISSGKQGFLSSKKNSFMDAVNRGAMLFIEY